MSAKTSLAAPAAPQPLTSSPPPPPISAPSPLVRPYLIAFNLLSCLSWLYVWSSIVHHLVTSPHPISTLYSHIALPLQITQSLAILEILHSLLGLVRSPLLTTLLQVSSRLFIVWFILYPIPASRPHIGFVLCALSWATVEVPRYLFYAWNLASPSTLPSVLTWLRYSLFLVLYPSGITGEVLCIWKALPHLGSHPMTVEMPNSWNFAFSSYVLCCLILLLYLPGSPFMIQIMWAQRQKVLGTTPSPSKKEL